MWDKMKMANAIRAVRSKEMELKRASRVFEVPRSTLKDKVNNKETDVETLINTRLGRKPVLPYSLEEELVSYCLMI
jgi:ribosomal protein L13E